MQLRGGQDSPVSRLKHLDGADRAEIYAWRFEEQPTPVLPEIRKRIKERFGIELRRDGQLSEFWPWQRRQAQMDYFNETIAQDEESLARKYPNVPREKIRAKAIQRLYAVAELEDNPQFGLKVIGVDLKDERAALDREKFQFDAAKACLARLPELKVISQDKGLSDAEKVDAVRLKLFGLVAGKK
jgi:hypothetical protein